MNKHETDAIRRFHVRARMYQPAAMLVHGIASMPAKNAGALMAVGGIEGQRTSDMRMAVEAMVKSGGERPCIVPIRPVN